MSPSVIFSNINQPANAAPKRGSDHASRTVVLVNARCSHPVVSQTVSATRHQNAAVVLKVGSNEFILHLRQQRQFGLLYSTWD